MSQTITRLEASVRKIGNVTPATDEVFLYRGHSNRRLFMLIPSVLREDKFKVAEHTIPPQISSDH
jgi:hypothetical protein